MLDCYFEFEHLCDSNGDGSPLNISFKDSTPFEIGCVYEDLLQWDKEVQTLVSDMDATDFSTKEFNTFDDLIDVDTIVYLYIFITFS